MASRQRVTTTRVKTRVKKDGTANSAGYRACNICHGTGVIPKSNKKKKK